MSSESAYPELTTLKVVHNGIARRVKIPYDMDWKDFERKVCRLFNLSPPLITSYKDSMGVSVLVDNSEDFFFFLDEEYTGRLDIVISDLPESSDWTVVRTDTGKALKEAEDPSEVSVDEVHALNSPLTNSTHGSTHGSTIESPLFTSTKERPELNSNYADSEKDEIGSTRSITSSAKELPESVVNNQPSLNEIGSTSSINEELGSAYEDSQENVIKETYDESKYSTPAKANLVLVGDEELHSEVKEELVAKKNTADGPSPIFNGLAISDILANDNEFNNPIIEKEPAPHDIPASSEFSSNRVNSIENSVFSIGGDLGFLKDLISEFIPDSASRLAINKCPSTSVSNNDVVEAKDSISNVSKTISSKDAKLESLFEEDASKAAESVSFQSKGDTPVDRIGLVTSPEPFVQSDSVKQIQDLRQLCFRFGDSFRRHPSLLTTVELFTDQLAHGVPINISLLEEGLNRLASSSESNITPSEAFEELATNLAGSVSQLIQHVGDTFSSFIERDVTPVANSCSHQPSSKVTPGTSQDLDNGNLDHQAGNLGSDSPAEKPSFSKDCDSHRSRRHRCRRHKDTNRDINNAVSDEAGGAPLCNDKVSRSKIRHYHPRRHVHNSWTVKSNDLEHIHVSNVESNQGFGSNLKGSSFEPSNPKNTPKIEQFPMKERTRPVSLSPAPQIIPYFINNSGIRSEGGCPSSKLMSTVPLQCNIKERTPQPYHFNRDSGPYRPLSFNDSVGINPFNDASNNAFTDHGDLLHRIQICPPKPMDIPEMLDEKPADLGAEIDPVDVVLIEGLVTLRSMGFHDDDANLEALQLKSSIEQAVDYLLSR